MANQERSSSHISCAFLIDHVMSLKLCFPFYKLFIQMESPSSHISKSLSLLKDQEEKYPSFMNSASLKDHILFLKVGLPLLEILSTILDPKGLDLHIKDGLYDMRLELHSLSKGPIKGNRIKDLECAYYNLQEKMKHLLIRKSNQMPINDSMFRRKDSIVRISMYLLTISPLTKEIEDIKEKLILLQALFTYLADKSVHFPDENEELLAPLSSLLFNVTCLICLVDKMDQQTLEMKKELSDLIAKANVKEIYMVFLRASRSNESTSEQYLLDNMIKLLDCNAGSMIYLNDPSKNLFEKLKLLRNYVTKLPDELRLERFNFHFTAIEAIVWKSIPVLCTCYDRHMKVDMAREVNLAVSEVLDRTKQIQQDSREVKLYGYPKIGGEGFLYFFMRHLEELLKSRPESIEIIKNQLETLYVEFDLLGSLMVKITEHHSEHEKLGDLWTRFIGLAYQAEYVIDYYLVKNALDSRIIMSLSRIIEETKLMKAEVTAINTEKYHTQARDVAKTPIHASSKAADIATDEIVGFEDEAKKIKEYLLEDQKKLDIVSIAGMAGVGKTTLAKKVYEEPSIHEFFHVQAWCTVSQTYQKRDLLLAILSDVIGKFEALNKQKNEELAAEPLLTPDNKEINDEDPAANLLLSPDDKAINDEDLAAKLFRSLKGRRYFIVIDDLWDINNWNDFKRSFPDDRLCSRILITSRHHNLASQINNGNKVHTLREFSEVKSWELFAKKLFRKGSFSRELLVVGQQIAESCKGLPLTIVVMAGVLARVEKTVHKWKQIARELSSHIFSDSESQCRAILELSYNHLPDHLKSCFLYFAAFPEDEEIPIWKLKMLWIAERFVQYAKEKKLEDIAEEYILDLINRSLILPTKENSHGGVKACRIHDLLHEFCLRKAKEGSFLQVILVPQWSEIPRAYEEHRLIIDLKEFASEETKPSHNVRSLLHTGTGFDFTSSNFPFNIQNFMLLRVLDLGNIFISMYESRIELLIHLRYLALQLEYIAPSIANLWYLQSLVVKGRRTVPNSLWNMVNLRHVRINHNDSFIISRHGRVDESLLDNMQTLSTPQFVSKEEAENFLRRVPNLQELRCEFNNCWECLFGDRFIFPDLSFLDQLVSLKLFIKGSREWRNHCEFNFPPNLQKLSLSGILPKWEDIAEFAKNIKVLILSAKDCDEEWIVNDGDFPTLEYLKLSGLLIRKWIASEDSLPKLKQLVMSHCWDLDEIPPCFGELYTLQVIRISHCCDSVEDSAKKIQKVQLEELGNEEFKIYMI